MLETCLYFLSFDKYPQMVSSFAIIFSVMLFAFLLRLAKAPLKLNHFLSSAFAMYLFIFSISDGDKLSRFYAGLVHQQRLYNRYLTHPLDIDSFLLTKISLHRQDISFYLTFKEPQQDQNLAQIKVKNFLYNAQKNFCNLMRQEAEQTYRKKAAFSEGKGLEVGQFFFKNAPNAPKLELPTLSLLLKSC